MLEDALWRLLAPNRHRAQGAERSGAECGRRGRASHVIIGRWGRGGRVNVDTHLVRCARQNGIVQAGGLEAREAKGDGGLAALGTDGRELGRQLLPRAVFLHLRRQLERRVAAQRHGLPAALVGAPTPQILHRNVELDERADLLGLALLAVGAVAPGPVPEADIPLQVSDVDVPRLVGHPHRSRLGHDVGVDADSSDLRDG
mmetsp:Transcript_53564/g.139551  ORF Transcript_53564/g.139551 Transcript_53564/m.139551 type:complete len:201 (-) Transcript_53564:513-1115(-)